MRPSFSGNIWGKSKYVEIIVKYVNTRAGQSYNNKPFYAPFVNYKTALISDYGNEMSRVSNIYINVDR